MFITHSRAVDDFPAVQRLELQVALLVAVELAGIGDVVVRRQQETAGAAGGVNGSTTMSYAMVAAAPVLTFPFPQTVRDLGTLLLGCIADDFTGATDIASGLSRGGLSVEQHIGVPAPDSVPANSTDAVVIALKSRTAPVKQAVRESVASATWLQNAGAGRLFFKYCSTFDSTPRGNIGPVADALTAMLQADLSIVSPALPENRRTVYQGHLFVDGEPLDESPMASHPLTPMTDSSIVRLLGAQSQHAVGLIPFEDVRRGPAAIRARVCQLQTDRIRYAVADAVSDDDLDSIAAAFIDHPLLTGSSGLAPALGRLLSKAGGARPKIAKPFEVPAGPAVVLAGSCSPATRAQVEALQQIAPSFRISAERAAVDGPSYVDEIVKWALPLSATVPLLVYSSASPDDVRASHQSLGVTVAGQAVEALFGSLAQRLVASGARRVIVAGGETSGAVVGALGVSKLDIGPDIAPGVPWTRAEMQDSTVALALKSGNFGGPALFSDALAMLDAH